MRRRLMCFRRFYYFCSMFFIDTHTHLYLEEFDADRQAVVEQAIEAGVKCMLMPNVDEQTIAPMMELHKLFPKNCLPMMGLHPTSVKEDPTALLHEVERRISEGGFVAVGETGIDLYWDKTFFEQQKQAFSFQIELALKHKLPIVIHSRNSLEEIFQALLPYEGSGLKGVFHCFPGDVDQAEKAIAAGFLLGIGGVVSYKNSSMARVVEAVGLNHIILETDAPYLPPVPHRGKRNHPAYIPIIAARIAEILKTDLKQVAEITSQNAYRLFNL